MDLFTVFGKLLWDLLHNEMKSYFPLKKYYFPRNKVISMY